MKKCKKCGAPLEGFLFNTIGKLMGIKPSEQDPEVCNKCAEAKPAEETPAEAAPEAPEAAPEAPEAAPEAPEAAPEAPEAPAEEEEKKEEAQF